MFMGTGLIAYIKISGLHFEDNASFTHLQINAFCYAVILKQNAFMFYFACIFPI